MLKDITVGQYLPGDSSIHRLDPRVKLLVTAILMAAIFLMQDWRGLVAFGAFLGVIYAFSGLPGRLLLRGLRPILLILLFVLPVQIFFTPGEPLWSLGPLVISREGLWQAILLSYRIGALIICSSFLTLTTSPIALTDGLEYILKPLERFRFPAHEMAMMTTIALRFIPTFAEQAERITKAQKSRGADFESGSLWHRVRNLISILVPLLISAFRRADDLALAMEARCYQGGKNRTRLRQWQLNRGDYFTLGLGGIILVVAIGQRFW